MYQEQGSLHISWQWAWAQGQEEYHKHKPREQAQAQFMIESYHYASQVHNTRAELKLFPRAWEKEWWNLWNENV